MGDEPTGAHNLAHLRPLAHDVLGQGYAEDVRHPRRAVGLLLIRVHSDHIPSTSGLRALSVDLSPAESPRSMSARIERMRSRQDIDQYRAWACRAERATPGRPADASASGRERTSAVLPTPRKREHDAGLTRHFPVVLRQECEPRALASTRSE